MKWSFASVATIVLGIFGLFIILLFSELTVSNEQDYYSLKEAAEASMIESIDIAYYRLTGDVKIVKEKFVENFTRRFTETSTFGQGNYQIDFYQFSETPPKVSIRIIDKTTNYSIYSYNSENYDILNEITAILDTYK